MKAQFSTLSFAGGFLVGVACVILWTTSTTALPSLTPALDTHALGQNPVGNQPPDESGAVSVVSQPAGDSVMIESVTVPPPGVWVAVREVTGSTLGNVLGAMRANGPRSSLVIPLLRETVPDASYAIELYRDNGDDVFDLSSDSVYVDFTTSQPVISYFKTAP